MSTIGLCYVFPIEKWLLILWIVDGNTVSLHRLSFPVGELAQVENTVRCGKYTKIFIGKQVFFKISSKNSFLADSNFKP